MNYDIFGNYKTINIEHFDQIKQPNISKNGRCGNQGDNTTCPNNKCCSDDGYCIHTNLCRRPVNSIYDGQITSTNYKYEPDINNSKYYNDTYCYKNVYCDVGLSYDKIINDDRCGINYNNKKCQSDRYCTDNGWCNTSNVQRVGNKNSNYDGPEYKEPLIVAPLQLQVLQPNDKSII